MNNIRFKTDGTHVELYDKSLSFDYKDQGCTIKIQDPEALKLIAEGLRIEKKTVEKKK